jgi:hypothetical protein
VDRYALLIALFAAIFHDYKEKATRGTSWSGSRAHVRIHLLFYVVPSSNLFIKRYNFLPPPSNSSKTSSLSR